MITNAATAKTIEAMLAENVCTFMLMTILMNCVMYSNTSTCYNTMGNLQYYTD